MRSDSNAVSFRPSLAQVQAMELEVDSEVILDGTQAKLTSMDSCLWFRATAHLCLF